MQQSVLRVLASLLCLLLAATASAQLPRVPGAPMRAAGMGDAGRATSTGTAALTFNPAGMSAIPFYEIGAGYAYQHGIEGHTAFINIADNSSYPYIAAGLGYAYRASEGLFGMRAGGRDSHDLRFALSSGFRSESVGVFGGATFRLLYVSLADGDGDYLVALDTGLLVDVAETVRFAFVAANVVHSGDVAIELPRQVGGGASFHMAGFVLAADAMADLEIDGDPAVLLSAGAEYALLGFLPLRAGFAWDQRSGEKRATGGLGYRSETFAADLGYQHDVEHSRDFFVGLDVRFLLP